MKKIKDFNNVCKHWEPSKRSRGTTWKDKKCATCKFCLFAYCWLDEYGIDETVTVALDFDLDSHKRKLLERIKKVERGLKNE